MLTVPNLIRIADRFRELADIPKETTLSHRMFGDSKKLRQLRDRSTDLTLSRFIGALSYLADNWPDDHPRPSDLDEFIAWRSAPRSDDTPTPEAAE